MEQNVQNMIVSLRYLLNGKGFFKASRSLERMMEIHCGLRKDGKTPEYVHQLSIAHYLRAFMNHLSWPEETFITVFYHDAVEDYPHLVTLEGIGRSYGLSCKVAVDILTKTGKKPQYYYELIAADPIASIVKGADRIHNFQSMVGVFSEDKQQKYIIEAEQYILPAIEKAALTFPEQEPIYANIGLVLRSQIELIREIHKASFKEPVICEHGADPEKCAKDRCWK